MMKFLRIFMMGIVAAVTIWFSSIIMFRTFRTSVKPLFEKDIVKPNEEEHQTGAIASTPETMLVILTYMRSGSSFTSDLIQNSPDVFYVFEPLWGPERTLGYKQQRFYIDKTENGTDHLFRETLQNFLTCNVKDVDLFTLRQFHMKNSLKTLPYHACVVTKPGLAGVLDCLPLLEHPCRKSRVSFVKTIRYAMKDMEYLLEKHSQIKIIHLIRDPRATLLSQRNMGQFNWKNLNSTATKLCERMDKDLQSSAEMKSKYPGRIATLRYEDLADDPYVILEQIYSFLGLDLTAKIKEYVHNATAATSDQQHCVPLCTRKNTTVVKSKWRQLMSIESAIEIDSLCKTVYQKVGYIPVKDEASLKNIMIPVHSAPPQGVTFRH